MRPPGPVPRTWARSTPRSLASFLAAGTTWTRRAPAPVSWAAIARRTSSSTTRPLGPVPDTWSRSTSFCLASLRATGVTWAAPALPRAPGALRTLDRRSGLDCDGRGTLSPGSPITATMTPTSTVAPSWAVMWATMPATGDSSSELIFAVSISTRGCPASTESPSFTSHFTRSPSSMFIPHWGSRTLVAMFSLL